MPPHCPRRSRCATTRRSWSGSSRFSRSGFCTKPSSAAALWSEAKDPKVNQAEFERCLALNRRFWDQHRPFFQELAQAARIFVLRDAPADRTIKPTPPNATIETRTKANGRDVYLLTANASSNTVSSTFTLPAGFPPKTLHVLFENRTVPAVDGRFTDAFPAYAVHVYATAPDLP